MAVGKSMKKIKIYLETSVVSGYFDSHLPDRQSVTRAFFKTLKKYGVFISTAVFEEITMSEEPKRSRLIRLVKNVTVLDSEKEGVKNLAQIYVANRVVPAKYFLDAIHLACATFYNMDVLVSWNFKHMVNFKTKLLVNSLNKRYNYGVIEISSPLEL